MRRAAGWLRENLFSTPLNSLLTVAALALLWLALPPLLSWALFAADFQGSSRADCSGAGACWVFVRVHLEAFIYGPRFPADARWRVDLALLLLPLLAAPLALRRMPHKGWYWLAFALGYPLLAWWLFHGGGPLEVIPTSRWGGLFLTLVIAGVGIAAALPLGIVLALGRRSQLPIVRAFCSVFIEFWRGVPLVTVLFMASVMLPLFLPYGTDVDKLLRALVGVALFSGAYMAEVVRGGLQGIPSGQYEAAQALGLGYWPRMRLIILPQALRMVIPGIVNSFIALFKDTTLVFIIGLFDLLGAVQQAATDARWLGFATEGYVFAGLVFWAFCYAMSRYSRHLEQRLHTGQQTDIDIK